MIDPGRHPRGAYSASLSGCFSTIKFCEIVTPRSQGSAISPSKTIWRRMRSEHRLKRRAEGGGSIEAVVADQPEGAGTIEDRNQPMAVMFDLVQPAVAIERNGVQLLLRPPREPAAWDGDEWISAADASHRK